MSIDPIESKDVDMLNNQAEVDDQPEVLGRHVELNNKEFDLVWLLALPRVSPPFCYIAMTQLPLRGLV